VIAPKVFSQTLAGFLLPIAPLLEDPRVSEVMVNDYRTIYVERGGRLERTDAAFPSEEDLEAAVRNVAQFVGRLIDPERPVLDARLPDGSRVCVIIPPISRHGISASIRRFPKERLTMGQLIELGSLTRECAEFLRSCVIGKRNLIVAGGTGSGKTSFLNVLSAFVPAEERILVLEDSSELQLAQEHALYLETRPPDARGRGAVTIRDLLRASLRMRPDRIVVGECRGGEALDLLQAMTTGHGGSLSTVHATHALDTLNRLEVLCLMSDVELPHAALRQQVASAIDLIVHTARFNDGTRKVTEVTECRGLVDGERYELRPLYLYERSGHDPGTGLVAGRLRCTGERPSFAADLVARGLTLDPAMS
jgi:pilus assembly protein CpaF